MRLKTIRSGRGRFLIYILFIFLCSYHHPSNYIIKCNGDENMFEVLLNFIKITACLKHKYIHIRNIVSKMYTRNGVKSVPCISLDFFQ